MAEGAGVGDPYGRGHSAPWADFNNDGYLDLLVANAPRDGAPSRRFKNNGDGPFSPFLEFNKIYQDGNEFGCWTDFSSDGLADLTIFSVGDGGTVSLCENNGGAGFGLKPEAIPA
ncbi:MAG: FG-GAP repeat domain-containing protein [Candidatus Aminicenantales bacterium]